MLSTYQLIVANRILSSWSLRAWLVMRWSGVKFTTRTYFMDSDSFAAEVRRFSPLGLVPLLQIEEGGQLSTISDSLAIAETMAEVNPKLWPQDKQRRAIARSVCSFIHAQGIMALRSQCSMNLSNRFDGFKASPEVLKELANLEALMQPLLNDDTPAQRGSIESSPGIMEAFLAPVAARVDSYFLPVAPRLRSYLHGLLRLPAVLEWVKEAKLEEENPARLRNNRYDGKPTSQKGDFPLLKE